MKSGPRIMIAVVIGYFLGRTRRMKMAMMLGGVLAGRKLGTDPRQLLGKASEFISSSPEFQQLSSTVRGRLLEAAKTAATAAASNKIDSLGESLTERASKIRNAPYGDAEEASPEEGTTEQKSTSGQSESGARNEIGTEPSGRGGPRPPRRPRRPAAGRSTPPNQTHSESASERGDDRG